MLVLNWSTCPSGGLLEKHALKPILFKSYIGDIWQPKEYVEYLVKPKEQL